MTCPSPPSRMLCAGSLTLLAWGSLGLLIIHIRNDIHIQALNPMVVFGAGVLCWFMVMIGLSACLGSRFGDRSFLKNLCCLATLAIIVPLLCTYVWGLFIFL